MSLNRTLVAGASAVLAGLGTNQALISTLSFECRQAIREQMPDAVILQACPVGFNDGWLLGIILLGSGIFLLINFWQDIFRFVGEKLGIE